MPDKKTGRPALLALILIGVLVVVVIWLLFFPRYQPAINHALSMQCRSNLRSIGMAMVFYASDNDGWFPAIEPGARKVANAHGVPAGCVVSFRDEDNTYKASGLGLLQTGGYLTRKPSILFYCPSAFFPDNKKVSKAFRFDKDEQFWRSAKAAPSNGDGIGELPGNPDVIISTYVLRYNGGNEWGATKGTILKTQRAIVSDLLFFGHAESKLHGGSFNVLFTDGAVKAVKDPKGAIPRATKNVAPENIEKIVDTIIFPIFDTAYRSD